MLHPCYTHDPNLVTTGQQVAEIMQMCDPDVFYDYDDLKPSKVGQGDLVFGVRLGCASGSAHTRLQVSVYSSYDLCHPGCPRMFFAHCDHFDPGK